MTATGRRAFLGLFGVCSVVGLGAYDVTRLLPGSGAVSRRDVEDLLTVADVVHPADPGVFESAISSYLSRLGAERERALRRTLDELNDVSNRRFGAPLRGLTDEEGELLFEVLGVNRVPPRPRGTLAERVGFHLVNATLFAILTTPAGTERFGIRNPVGYPGGIPHTSPTDE